MPFPAVTAADWRAQVDKELAGKPFEKVLVQETLEGIAIQPLYLEAPPQGQAARSSAPKPFRICMRHGAKASIAELIADVQDGADALWLPLEAATEELVSRPELDATFFLFEMAALPARAHIVRVAQHLPSRFVLGFDPIAAHAKGQASAEMLARGLQEAGALARLLEQHAPDAAAVQVSTLPYHDAGADAAEELACALSAGVRYFEALLNAGFAPDAAARHLSFQLAVGRDTFLELCKLRALQICWQKVQTALGVKAASRARLHAVCSERTLSERDPWVNMLRVTTQMFSAALGGADWVTPQTFDQASGTPSSLGRRVARNTGLVLREESHFGRVSDPAGGSYALESLTDALARKAWERFQKVEREGGIVAALQQGRLAQTLDAIWQQRLEGIHKRKTPLLGVSEFAHLDEKLPQAPSLREGSPPGALPVHRDAASFERLRTLADTLQPVPEALLVTLGPLAESRARAGFAASFFAAGGIRSRESTQDEAAQIACLCGSDERYAAEAVQRARALKAAGCSQILLAGRPGALEAALREAGVDGFIFAGVDVVATLSALLRAPS